MTAVTEMCVNATMVRYFIFFIRTGLYFHIKRTPSTGTKDHWRLTSLCCGKVLSKVALNAASHSDSPCTNRGEGNKPDWSWTGNSSWDAFWILPFPFEMLPIASLPSQMGVWEKAKGFVRRPSCCAISKALQPRLKMPIKIWRLKSNVGSVYLQCCVFPSWTNLLCFWGQKGNNSQPTCVICA